MTEIGVKRVNVVLPEKIGGFWLSKAIDRLYKGDVKGCRFAMMVYLIVMNVDTMVNATAG
jgi:hypothetical protein